VLEKRLTPPTLLEMGIYRQLRHAARGEFPEVVFAIFFRVLICPAWCVRRHLLPSSYLR
jgi:hypothetical protein